MRQTYYGVSNELYQIVEKDSKQYSQLVRLLFQKQVDKDEKIALLKQRDEYKASIQDKLSTGGTIIGFLNSEQIENLQSSLSNLQSQEVREYLSSNCIPHYKLEEVIISLMMLEETTVVTNLIFFLEQAKHKKQNVVVWIM